MSNYLFYPRLVTLALGKRIFLRFLNQGDREGIINLFQEASEGDLCFLKQDFQDPKVINRWLDELRQRQVLALVAVDLQGHLLLASANLHLGRDSVRHVGEIRLFVSAPFRGLGLGSLLLEEMMDLALDEDLQWLQVEVIADHNKAIRFFRSHGFAVKTNLQDYFLHKDGMTYDLVLMLRPMLNAGPGGPSSSQTGKGTTIQGKAGVPRRT